MKVRDLIEELVYGELCGTSLLVLDTPKLTDTALRRVIVAINDAMTELAYEIPYYTTTFTYAIQSDTIKMAEPMKNTYTQILSATISDNNGQVIDCNINIENGEFRSPTIFIEEGTNIKIAGIHLDTNSSNKWLHIRCACIPPLLSIANAEDYIKDNNNTELKLPRMLWAILKVSVASKALLNSGSADGVQLSQMYMQKYMGMLQQLATNDLINTSKVHNPNYLKRYGFL